MSSFVDRENRENTVTLYFILHFIDPRRRALGNEPSVTAFSAFPTFPHGRRRPSKNVRPPPIGAVPGSRPR